MSHILLVMYSYTGNCRKLACTLHEQQGWPIAEVTELQPRRGAQGPWGCLLNSLLHRPATIHYAGPPPVHFDAVVLVAPIWAYCVAGPMYSFIEARHDLLPDVAVVSVTDEHGGSPDVIAKISRLTGRSPVLLTEFSTREVDYDSCASRLQAFGNAVKAAQDSNTLPSEQTGYQPLPRQAAEGRADWTDARSARSAARHRNY